MGDKKYFFSFIEIYELRIDPLFCVLVPSIYRFKDSKQGCEDSKLKYNNGEKEERLLKLQTEENKIARDVDKLYYANCDREERMLKLKIELNKSK